jgi:hypothetical protein
VGGFADDEIPLLVMLFYLFRDVEASRPWAPVLILVSNRFERQSTRETTSGGEFGWGGTSVKR